MPNVQPKSGKNHAIFGSQFYKHHKISDAKWRADDKITQYDCIASVYQKHHDLEKVRQQSEFNAKVEKYAEQSKTVESLRATLKNLQAGDIQRIRNIFCDDPEQQLMFSEMSSAEIMDCVEHRLFEKRKALDRLTGEKKRLRHLYEQKLLDLAKLQDRVRYKDGVELPDELLARRLRVELENSNTRLKAYDGLNKDCIEFVATLSHDSLYYKNILDSLHSDVVEQAEIIDSTIRLGKPALANMDRFKKEFNELEAKIDRDARKRLATLSEYKRKLTENEQKLRSLIRKDDDFELFQNRYARETDSMLNIQREFKDVEKDVKALCAVTACADPSKLYEYYAKAFKDENNIRKTVARMESNMKKMTETITLQQQIEDSVVNDYTNDDAKRTDEMLQLDAAIEAEKERSGELDEKIRDQQHKKFRLQYSLQRFADLLKNVGEPQTKIRQMYPSQALELPLLELQYGVMDEMSEPPETIEEDVDKLFEIIVERVNLLMQRFNENADKFNELTDKSERLYHDRVLEELSTDLVEVPANANESAFENDFDPSVPLRADLKLQSEKIVMANSKEED